MNFIKQNIANKEQKNMQKTIITTGGNGQDGSFLTEKMLEAGHKVVSIIRRSASEDKKLYNIEHLLGHSNLIIENGDLTDASSLFRIVAQYKPDEFYNLAAQSHVGASFTSPESTMEINSNGVLNCLEAIRIFSPSTKFYQASTSEMFGDNMNVPQSEDTVFSPNSPYACAKMAAHNLVVNYRKAYGLFACSGILFNHESPLRGLEFVTRKITDGVAKIRHGKLDCLELGNLNAMRDWGFAGDYVEGMWKMLQLDFPGSYVLATNRCVSVRDFALMAFRNAGIDVRFQGEGPEEVAVEVGSRRIMLRVNKAFHRPAESTPLVGDAAKARAELGWEPSTSLEAICAMMVAADLRRNQDGNSRASFLRVVQSA